MRISDWSSDVCSSDLLTGAALTEAHWDIFWTFYQDTGARKWCRSYLTRAFFSLLGERMADRVLLLLALRQGQPIPGPLHLLGPFTLFAPSLCFTVSLPHHFRPSSFFAIVFSFLFLSFVSFSFI